jgi:hypothetical protein
MKRVVVDSWNPFDMRPRTRALQALYIGLLWAALLGLLMFLLVGTILGGRV